MAFKYDLSVPPRTVLVNSSQILHRGPCLLTGAVAIGNGGENNVSFYDGPDANSEQKMILHSANHTTVSPVLPGGVEFHSALFVTVRADTNFVMAMYYPAEQIAGPRIGEAE
jgi:hypothetical protein